MGNIKRAGLGERLHFLLTGEIPNYWVRSREDVHRTYLAMLSTDSPDSPFSGWTADAKKELLNFFGCSKISYKQARPFLQRHRKGSSLTPDYFPCPGLQDWPTKPVLGKPGSGRHYYPWDKCQSEGVMKCSGCSWKSECPVWEQTKD